MANRGERANGGDDPITDDVPVDLVAAAKALLKNAPPRNVIPLVFDSLVDGGDSTDSHSLRFCADDLEIEVNVEATSRNSTLFGRVRPPAPRRIEIVLTDTETGLVVLTDDSGEFEFTPVGVGVIHLEVSEPDGKVARTESFRI